MARAAALPDWPRVQNVRTAALYAGYGSPRDFLRDVATGAMPPPFVRNGEDVWDRLDLDGAIDALKAGAQRPRRWQDQAPARV